MKGTVKEIAEALDVDEDAARGLVKFLMAIDPPMARFRGERAMGSGRGPSVYEIDGRAPGAVEEILARIA